METSSYRYCGVCGQPLEPGATVCGNCGAAVDSTGEGAPATGEQTMAMPAAAAGAGAAGPAARPGVPRERAVVATASRPMTTTTTKGCRRGCAG